MIAALLLAVAPSSWCNSLYTVALATAEARVAGMDRAHAELAAQQLPTLEAQRAGEQIVTLAYTYNADGRIEPEHFARLVRQACVRSEQQP